MYMKPIVTFCSNGSPVLPSNRRTFPDALRPFGRFGSTRNLIGESGFSFTQLTSASSTSSSLAPSNTGVATECGFGAAIGLPANPFGDLALLGDVDADELVDARRQVVARVARERLDVDHLAALAVRDLQRRVADLARLLLEDRADQLLLSRQLGLALRRHLADEQVARADLGADADDAALVEVLERLLRAVGDVTRDLLVAELRRTGVDLVLVDVDRGQDVLLDQALRDHDRVLEVVALPRHEGDQQVRAERELAHVGRAAIRQHLFGPNALAEADDRLLVDQRPLVGAHELGQRVLVLALPRVDD